MGRPIHLSTAGSRVGQAAWHRGLRGQDSGTHYDLVRCGAGPAAVALLLGHDLLLRGRVRPGPLPTSSNKPSIGSTLNLRVASLAAQPFQAVRAQARKPVPPEKKQSPAPCFAEPSEPITQCSLEFWPRERTNGIARAAQQPLAMPGHCSQLGCRVIMVCGIWNRIIPVPSKFLAGSSIRRYSDFSIGDSKTSTSVIDFAG